MYDIARLPLPVLVRIIAYSDPIVWWSVDNRTLRAVMNTTSFRCWWIAHLTKQDPQLQSVDAVVAMCQHVLDPVTSIVGSDSWITDSFVLAMHSSHHEAFCKVAPALLWRVLKVGDQAKASVVVQLAQLRLDMFDGQLIRELTTQCSELWLLQWLCHNGLHFRDVYSSGKCFETSQLIKWVMASRIELLTFLSQQGIHLPVRLLIEYALGNSTPDTIAFLMEHGSDGSQVLSWNDLLLMASTDDTTHVDVYRYVVSKTEASIVWTYAASCLASHAIADKHAYEKFLALRSMPHATLWIVRSIRGRTPIECLCERLTYENLTYVSPFIREYVRLGVSTTNMPPILSALCQ
ncbi:hypothetical protein COEREDRAFT_10124 [Coemansia reversa NRRL 1564]|uniref:Uncharacterized protein n=1 Tax=Coemansia reversa (strain ATCC 12441 / NRRL 1564) TaxID=763665 RepID=A0A2G5B7J6_COERN|nr:hypothetical protein COEREDRAFT_10124 [Coemansia reversa NRRL 1564]|eukprot:PIA14697.1 hypothetical protein COEREDRAFT_10124 [Coemansia reversa NRRL 1564]